MKTAVFIISHNRPEVYTYHALRLSGYRNDIYIIIDDKDPQLDEYQKRYKENILIYSKDDYTMIDMADLLPSLNSATTPKYAAFRFASEMKLDAMAIFDDDLKDFKYRYESGNKLSTKWFADTPKMQSVLDACFEFVASQQIPVCLSFYPAARMFPDTMRKFIRKCVNMFVTTPSFGFKTIEKICPFRCRFFDDDIFCAKSNSVGALVFAIQNITFVSQTFDMEKKNTGGMNDIYNGVSTYSRKFQYIISNPSNTPISVFEKDGKLSFGTPTPEYTRILSERWKR